MMPETSTIASLSEVRSTISNLTKEEFNRILAYSLNSLTVKYRVKYEKGMLGKGAHDFVQEAFEAVLKGDRKWNKDAYPKFLDFIKGAIDSRIGGFLGNKIRQATLNQDSQFFIENGSNENNIEKEIITLPDNEQKKKQFLKLVEGNQDEEDVLECILEGIWPPREIVEFLEWEESKVTTVLRRLRRKKAKFDEQLKDYGKEKERK